LQSGSPCFCVLPRRVFELSCVLSLFCIVLYLPCLCVSCFVSFCPCSDHAFPLSLQEPHRPSRQTTRDALPSRDHTLPLLGHAPAHSPFSDTFDSPPSRARSLTSPPPSDPPPSSTPEPGHLHLEVSLLLMMFHFGHTVEIRRCSFQRHADDSHLPKGRFVLVGRSNSFPLVGRSLSRPSPRPCNVARVSRGRMPVPVSPTCEIVSYILSCSSHPAV
jgi:hypothetical protein